ncbi:MAG TPA: MlaD family protein [Thermoleophilaceae bacterium]|nr:MlaD family protein [Thermoleophilaceae bacterium]
MKKALSEHLGDFVAILALILLAGGIGVFILSNQRLRFPLVEDKPVQVKVELPDAQAVQPGQGQTVRTAGVEIGQIGKVELQDGKAVVTMELEPKYKGYIKRDATALLRTKTGLKDMFIEVDPGTGKPLPANGRISSQNTAPDIDPDEVLSALDDDTRDYLKLLVSGAGKGLAGRGNDLQETFARLGPLNRDTARVTSAIARRRTNLKNLINKYGLLTKEVSTKDREIVRLVRSSNEVFDALAGADAEISDAVRQLPGSLRQTESTLAKVDTLGDRLGPALQALRPPFRQLDETNAAVLPFVREATPQIRDQIRPFARVAGPFTRDLGLAARNFNKAAPDLTQSFEKLNRFFNIGAFNANGNEKLGGDFARDRDRDEGYLYWLAWAAQNTTGLFATADGQGVFRRVTLGSVNCTTVTALNEGLKPVVDQLGALGLCSPSGTPTGALPELPIPNLPTLPVGLP